MVSLQFASNCADRLTRQKTNENTHRRTLNQRARERRAIVSLHDDVVRLVSQSGVREGMVLVNAMHITGERIYQRQRSGPTRRLRTVTWKS